MEGVRLATDPSLVGAYDLPGQLKPTWHRVVDHAWWAARYGGAYPYYYVHGMDAKHGGEYRQYRFVKELQAGFANRNRRPGGESYFVAVLQDKYFFSLIAESLGHPVPD